MSNLSTSFDSSSCYTEQELIFNLGVQKTFLLPYGLVSIIGTVGNIIIVITVIRFFTEIRVFDILFTKSRTPDLRTGTNLLVCNMSLSDIMMCLTAAPLTPMTGFTGQWFLGQIPCKILPACQVGGRKITNKSQLILSV